MCHGLSAFSICIGILLSGIPAPVVAQTPNPDSQYTGGSDIYVFSDSAGTIITGRLVDLHNGEPVANAQVYSGPTAGNEGRLEAGHWSVWVTERSEYPDGIMTKIVDYVLAPGANHSWRLVKRKVLLYVEQEASGSQKWIDTRAACLVSVALIQDKAP